MDRMFSKIRNIKNIKTVNLNTDTYFSSLDGWTSFNIVICCYCYCCYYCFVWQLSVCLSDTLVLTYARLIHTGQFLNGLAGPIAMGAPPALSAEWFPPEQRTTATAIATVSNVFGLAVSFLLGLYDCTLYI